MSVSNTNRWKLGLFVTVTVALTIGVLLWLGISQLQRRTTPAYFYFSESVSGLEVGSPVKFLGVEVGRVDEIFPAPDRRHIEVRAGIYTNTLAAWGIAPGEYEQHSESDDFVSPEVRGQLVTSALTSVSFIQLAIFDPAKHPLQHYTFPIPWETIHTLPSTFKSLERGLMDALERWPEISNLAIEVLRDLDQGVEDLNIKALSAGAVDMMAEVEDLSRKLDESPLVDRRSATFEKIHTVLDDLHVVLSGLRGDDGAIARFESAAQAFEEDFEGSDIPAAVAAVEDAGRGFEGSSQELTLMLQDMRKALTQLNATLGSVQNLTDLLNRDPASLLYGKSPTNLPFRR